TASRAGTAPAAPACRWSSPNYNGSSASRSGGTMSRVEAKRRAREIRANLRATGDIFTKAEFYRRTLDACADLTDSALEGLVAGVVDQVHNEAARERRDDQPGLFDEEGDYNLGNGVCIGKEHAQWAHIVTALGISEGHKEATLKAHERKERE